MSDLSVEELSELFVHDTVNGLLYWKERDASTRAGKIFNGRFAGKQAGCINSLGYMVVGIGGKLYLVHRILFALRHGSWPEHEIDHAGARSENLKIREATHAQNQWNRSIQSNNTTGHKHIQQDGSHWRVEIMANGVRLRRRFAALPDAIAFAHAAREKMHGEFANHG